MFLPTTIDEVKKLGWNALDIILVSGDCYIDSPFNGVAVIGKLLYNAGYRVGIIAQPKINSKEDITRLGEPELFWGVSGGSVDSMVANYTATKKKRNNDDYTPGGINTRRPDRAVTAYSNLIRKFSSTSKPIVLGGIEASLRRTAHYDFWSNQIRPSILIEADADYLIYGMGEKAILELAKKIKKGKLGESVNGLCYISEKRKYEYLQLPSFEECLKSKDTFAEMFNLFYHNNDPLTAKGLCQATVDKYVIQNPPQPNPTVEEIDSFYNLDYERDVHPYYAKMGNVRALETIRFSITTHRGCYGECNFCAIAVHQGRTIVSRSKESIIKEANSFTKHKKFNGNILDVGGPTANMYDYECNKKLTIGVCEEKRCVFPDTCRLLKPNHKSQIELLKEIRSIAGIKKVFVASGIRYDLVTDDKVHGYEYLKQVVSNHTSGQMKIAPEHMDDKVLELMGKPGKKSLEKFRDLFYQLSKEAGKEQYLTYYMIAAHPGCTDKEMEKLKTFASEKLQISPEQVQIFTPTPSTYSSLMYYTEKNPFTGEKLFVEKNTFGKEKQKQIVTTKPDDKFWNKSKSFHSSKINHRKRPKK